MQKEFLGRGWAFPFGFGAAGGEVSFSEYEDNIRQCITIILGTRPGERQMLPEFGCDIYELIFAPNTSATATLVQHHVERALRRWESRIEVLSVDSWPDAAGVIKVQVNYKIISTGSEQQLDLNLSGG